MQPVEPQIDESVEVSVKRSIEVPLEQGFEVARIEAEPEDITEEQNVEENRFEAENDVKTQESESISAESMVEDQNSGAKSPKIPAETPSEQPEVDDSSDIPYSNMSYDEFERCQRAKIEDLETFFRDLNRASTQRLSSSAPHGESSKSSKPSASENPMPDFTPPSVSEPILEMLSNQDDILKEKKSRQWCLFLHFLIARQKGINSYLPPVPSQILSNDGEDVKDEDIDNFDDLLDLFSLQKTLRTIAERIVPLQHPLFWMSAEEKLQEFHILLFYQFLRDEAWDAIDEICCTPIYDISDDDFDDYDSDDE